MYGILLIARYFRKLPATVPSSELSETGAHCQSHFTLAPQTKQALKLTSALQIQNRNDNVTLKKKVLSIFSSKFLKQLVEHYTGLQRSEKIITVKLSQA